MEISSYKKRGFQKTRIDGKIYEIDESPTLNKNIKHDIDIYIDGFINDKKEQQRIAESIETTLSLSDGLVYVDFINENLPKEFKKSEKIVFSSKFACPESGFTIEEIEPRLFSFNSPYGACPECEGIGVDLNLIKEQWLQKIREICFLSNLKIPDGTHQISGGKDGRHSEHLGHILTEMQYLPIKYPDARW